MVSNITRGKMKKGGEKGGNMKEKIRKRKDTEKIESKEEKEKQSGENKGKKSALE
jgi:hypothetical protein